MQCRIPSDARAIDKKAAREDGFLVFQLQSARVSICHGEAGGTRASARSALLARLVLDRIYDALNEFGAIGSAQAGHMIPAFSDCE